MLYNRPCIKSKKSFVYKTMPVGRNTPLIIFRLWQLAAIKMTSTGGISNGGNTEHQKTQNCSHCTVCSTCHQPCGTCCCTIVQSFCTSGYGVCRSREQPHWLPKKRPWTAEIPQCLPRCLFVQQARSAPRFLLWAQGLLLIP